MARPVRPDLHARFLAVVQRGLERAKREEAAYRASLRAESGFADQRSHSQERKRVVYGDRPV